jgi:hypothetical protein
LKVVLAQMIVRDNLRRNFAENIEWPVRVRPTIFCTAAFMSEPDLNITQEEFEQLRKKFSEIKHAINNALAVMMALSEMSQRRPDYSEKLATTVLSKAPQIVSSLQEFTQILNEKAGIKPADVAGAK